MIKFWEIFVLFLAVALLSSSVVRSEDEEDKPESDDDTDSTESESTESIPEENDVLVLSNKNFEQAINSNDIILVEFYAPWCGHCKSLAPEYEKAAKELKESSPPVALAKVDATVEEELAKIYEVSGFPTLKFFKKGEKFDYDGPREANGIVNYMKERADPNWAPPPEACLTLTKDNFDETVNNAPLILVEFYAPWCGHCKQLAPEYELAAQRLKMVDNPIPLAKVDATQETDLASKFGVTGYPTLKIFRNGVASEYKGPRQGSGIIDYMLTQQGDPSKEVKTLKDLKSAMKEDDVTVVGFFADENDALYKTYQQSGQDLREDFKFIHTFDKPSRDHYKVNSGSVVVFNAERFYTKYEPKWHVFDKSDAKADDLVSFYNKHSVPLVGHLTNENQEKRYTKRPLCVVYFTVDWSFDHRQATQAWRQKFAKVAKDYKDYTFAIADEDEMKSQIEQFGLDESGEELSIGCFGLDGKRYPMEPMEEYEEDEFREFMDKIKAGKIKPHIKSAPVPKKQKGPVTVVVGKTFDDIVLDKTKDVLIEFYAPWCGHCKQLEPKYKELAKKLKKEKNLVIAKMDATANDAPTEYAVEGFPTIYFAPADNKKSPIKYDKGAREVEDFVKFIKEHATVAFKKDEL